MKKEERETDTGYFPPKNESYDEFRCITCGSTYSSEAELKKHKFTHASDEIVSKDNTVNGVIEINDSSSDADNDDSLTNDRANVDSSKDTKLGLKKEELSEEKFIVDEPAAIGNRDEMDLFQNDSSDPFPFTFNPGDDLSDNFLDDVNPDNPLAESEPETSDGNQQQEEETEDRDYGKDDGTNEENYENAENTETDNNQNNDSNDNIDNNDSASTVAADDQIENENAAFKATDIQEAVSEARNENVPSEERTLEPNEENDASNYDNDIMSNATAVKATEESEKQNEREDDAESRRPSSRESVTSTASSSSERVLTIRSASEVNKIVASASNVVVKTEKVPECGIEKVEKLGLSVVNPTQLGITNCVAGENLLQNATYVPSADPMIGYMQPNLQNGGVPTQCDVCETTFTDPMILEDHRANAGHYKCHYTAECASFVFQNLNELTTHQQTLHGMIPQSPVQQLQHQVQNIPIRYQMDQTVGGNYQTIPPYQQTRNVVPQVYPNSQNNVHLKQYAPRIQYGSVRGSVQMTNQSNAIKRGPTPPVPRIMPAKRRCLDNFPNRNGDADCKVVSVQKPENNDDVVAQLSKSITITTRQENQKKNETAAVANMLANRGITVSSVPAKQVRNANAIAMLNLNSAVSLIPTNNKTSSFAVPQGRMGTGRPGAVTSPGRMTTVDLTGPENPRNKPFNRNSRFTCQLCDKVFFNQEQLNQHMITHRSASRKQLPYKCNNCSAQYPNQQSLIQHRQTCRRDVVASTNEMVIPIVDLKQPGSLQRLQSIGINYMIPLNALGSQSANGTFGIPILPFSSDRTPITNLSSCGISNILPVGPLKALGR